MAPKRSTPLDDPPSASSDEDETEDEQELISITRKTIPQPSSSEEEEEDEEEEEEEESEEEAVKTPIEKPKIENLNAKSVEASSEGESEPDSEEETPSPVKSIEKPKTLTPQSSSFDLDSDLKSPTASDFAIKPSKKINTIETPEKTPISKRPLSQSDAKGKRKINVSNGEPDDEKKSVIKRVWSDDDELSLLQGFIDYQSKTGHSPLSDMDGFYKFTMDSLPGNASKSQLYEKIRRLKKKFRINEERTKLNGVEPVFPKPHERKLFEVSKKIWGIDGCESVTGSTAKPKSRQSKSKAKIEVKEVEEDDEVKEVEEVIAKVEDFETLYPYWKAGLESEVSSDLKFPEGVISLIKKNLSSIGEAKAKEMNEKWEEIFENEAVLKRRRIELLSYVETTSVGK